MKKFLMTIISIIVATVGLISVVEPTERELILSNLSEIRYNAFSEVTDTFGASFMTGEREVPYIIDGIAQEKSLFGVLSVYFRIPTSSFVGTPTYSLSIDDDYYEGELERSPYSSGYVADIEASANDDSVVTLTVIWDDLEETIVLAPTSIGWEINWEKAMDIALENIDEVTKNKLIVDGIVTAEIHMKIINDPENVLGEYYWYFTIYHRDGSVTSYTIDPITGEILSTQIIE